MNLADMTPQQLRDEIERLARINRENCERLLQRDPSVPLSAIRALVQQFEALQPWQTMMPKFIHNGAGITAWTDCVRVVKYDELRALIDQLAALCPAPPEDQT